MKLRDIQHIFSTCIEAGSENNAATLKAVINNNRVAKTDRIRIYQNNIIQGLCNAILAAYPLCAKMVGEQFMKTMVREYIRHYKPITADLNMYGETLTSFIKTYAPAQSQTYLPDLARLEWRIHQSYHAADDEALDLLSLAKHTEDEQANMSVTLRSSVFLQTASYPLDDIIALCNGVEKATPVSLHKNKYTFLVYRPELRVNSMRLSTAEHSFLEQFTIPCTFQAALENTFIAHESIDPVALLQKFLSLNIFKAN